MHASDPPCFEWARASGRAISRALSNVATRGSTATVVAASLPQFRSTSNGHAPSSTSDATAGTVLRLPVPKATAPDCAMTTDPSTSTFERGSSANGEPPSSLPGQGLAQSWLVSSTSWTGLRQMLTSCPSSSVSSVERARPWGAGPQGNRDAGSQLAVNPHHHVVPGHPVLGQRCSGFLRVLRPSCASPPRQGGRPRRSDLALPLRLRARDVHRACRGRNISILSPQSRSRIDMRTLSLHGFEGGPASYLEAFLTATRVASKRGR